MDLLSCPRLSVLALVTLLLSACSEGGKTPADAPAVLPGVPVEVQTAGTETVIEQLRAVGTLTANESVVLRAEIAGRVAGIGFEEGTPVAVGTTLITLADAEYRAQVSESAAAVELDTLNFRRAQELAGKRMLSAQDFDTARSRLAQSRATLERYQALLDKTRLRAPFSGVVGLRQVSLGAYVQPGQDLVNLEDLDPVKAEFQVPEHAGTALHVGQAVSVQVDALPEQVHAGVVYAIDPRLDAQSRTYAVRARVANPDRLLRPGMFARIGITLATRAQAVVVDEAAIVPRGTRLYVFKVLDGAARLAPVQTGVRTPGRVEIRSGVQPGELIVTAGQMKLRDGVPVATRPPEAPP